MKYIVKHVWPDPRYNSLLPFLNLKEAAKEARAYTSEDKQASSFGVSTIYQDGKVIATRSWKDKNLIWYK